MNTPSFFSRAKIIFAALLLVLLGACATQPQPGEQTTLAATDADYPLRYLLGGCCPNALQISSLPAGNSLDDGVMFSLSSVFFDVDKATLRPEAHPYLDEIAQAVYTYQPTRISVEGHTDERASERYNQRLSERRAATVRDALVQRGVNSALIIPRGFGETRPIDTNNTAAGRQRNRRVDVILE